MKDDLDLEREREDLLRFINESTDESLRRALALVPEELRTPQAVTVVTSTEGTGNAREE